MSTQEDMFVEVDKAFEEFWAAYWNPNNTTTATSAVRKSVAKIFFIGGYSAGGFNGVNRMGKAMLVINEVSRSSSSS